MERDSRSPAAKTGTGGKTSSGTGRAVLAAFFAALLMKLFLFEFMVAQGRSMLPAIRPGAVLLVNKTAYGFRFPWGKSYLLRWARPRRGDVVVFYTPSGEIAVKRCALITEKDEFIALGDNSVDSFDSRSYGPIPLDAIMGKVFGIND
ncbi:MAG: signal peptidase I [Spirochaetaceae bacterium]|jgi:signal peptidase I|nr:signal peptidase I [Spirochaetaceae bacterium]